MKKLLLVAVAAAAAAVAVAVATRRPIQQPDQPSGTWEIAAERPGS
jgi:nitrous oxidase accessory protein NosD